jgi:hypothetical protein
MSTTALWLSGFALGVSALTFLWQVTFAVVVDTPRLKIALRHVVRVETTAEPGPVQSMRVVEVIITNRGKRPVWVRGVHLAFDKPPRFFDCLLPKACRRDPVGFMAASLPHRPGVDGPNPPPCQLEVYGHVVVAFDLTLIQAADPEARFIHAEVYSVLGDKTSRALDIRRATDTARAPRA